MIYINGKKNTFHVVYAIEMLRIPILKETTYEEQRIKKDRSKKIAANSTMCFSVVAVQCWSAMAFEAGAKFTKAPTTVNW